jgi:hypothetical protein
VVSELGHDGLVLPSGEKTRSQLRLVAHWRIQISRFLVDNSGDKFLWNKKLTSQEQTADE